MIILALDTASEQASVALRRDGFTVAEESLTTTDGHSQVLFQMIQTVLARASVSLSEVDCFAAASGPGSFTGVRICLTAAKGLAEAMGKPAAAVSNLRALAALGSAAMRNPILDARRGQIYTAIYNSKLELFSAEVVVAESDWVVNAGVERITGMPATGGLSLAASIALCAELDGPDAWQDPAELDASYVRRSDATMSWTDEK